jgi:hypothetical protein
MKSRPHKFGPHLTILPLPGGGVELGYTHHTVNLSPDPKGTLFTEAWPIFRRHGFAFRTEDYREVLARLRAGDLTITPGKNYRPSTRSLGAPPCSPLLAPRSSSLNISLELILPNGSSFVAMETAKATYLEIGLRGHLPILFDITKPGCPYEKALWGLEKKWPERCRG